MKPFYFSFLLLFFFGCQKAPCKKICHIQGSAFFMPYKIQYVATDHSVVNELIKKRVESLIKYIDKTYNHWNPESYLSQINKGAGYFLIDEIFFDVLCVAKKVHALSKGAYDPTLKPLISLYKKCLEEGEDLALIQQLKIPYGFSHLAFDQTSLVKENEKIEIDLDSLIKGKLVDLIAQSLDELRIKSYLIDFSGDLYGKGTHPEGRPWMVLTPETESQANQPISLNSQGIATSGTYAQRYFTKEGTTLSHILNSKSKTPLEVKQGNIASVTVRASTCTLADALATAALAIEDIEQVELFFNRVKEWDPTIDFLIGIYKSDDL